MAVTPKLELKQSQSLLMTPQLRQAISLLQLNNMELSSLIENELSSNPLLEKEDDRLQDYTPEAQTIDDYDADTPAPTPLEGADDNQPDIDYTNPCEDDFGSDREGYDNSDYSWYDYAKQKNHSADADFDFFPFSPHTVGATPQRAGRLFYHAPRGAGRKHASPLPGAPSVQSAGAVLSAGCSRRQMRTPLSERTHPLPEACGRPDRIHGTQTDPGRSDGSPPVRMHQFAGTGP